MSETGEKILLLISLFSSLFKCGSRGGTGGPDPTWKSTSYMGFYREQAIGPPGKSWTPLENVGTLKNDRFFDFFEIIDHLTSVK